MCYLPILDILFDNYDKLTETELKLFNIIKHIILKYLYEPRIEPINIDELTRDLKNINKLFEIQDLKNSNSKSSLIKNITSKVTSKTKVTGQTPIIIQDLDKKPHNFNYTRKNMSYL